MENASKALLIAGAILIAILLIAIGMMVFNSASGVVDTATAGMSDNEKTLHNKKFTIYEGIQSGTQVKELAKLVRDHNANTDNYRINDLWVIKTDGSKTLGGRDGGTTSLETGINNILNNTKTITPLGKYEVKCVDASHTTEADGLISKIEIYIK